MRYADSFRYITAHPGWFKNLALCGLCLIIPVIGQIVVIGYMFEVFDSLRRDPEKKSYPDFDFNRFSPYLMRGIWPFLVQFVTQMVVTVPVAVLYFMAMAVTMSASKSAGPIVAIVWLLYVALSIVMGLAIALVVWPMMTYAGVAQKFDFSGMIAYAKDFLRKTFKELAVSLLFLFGAAMVLAPLGYLACCVGILLVGPAVLLAQHHLKVQLYELYLERGGMLIPEPTPKVIPPLPESPEPPSDAIRPAPDSN